MALNLLIAKLPSGEHLLGKIVAEDKLTITLQFPCNIFPGEADNVSVLPVYRMFKEGMVVLDRSNILYSAKPNDDIAEQFEAAFEPKAVLVPDQKIILS